MKCENTKCYCPVCVDKRMMSLLIKEEGEKLDYDKMLICGSCQMNIGRCRNMELDEMQFEASQLSEKNEKL